MRVPVEIFQIGFTSGKYLCSIRVDDDYRWFSTRNRPRPSSGPHPKSPEHRLECLYLQSLSWKTSRTWQCRSSVSRYSPGVVPVRLLPLPRQGMWSNVCVLDLTYTGTSRRLLSRKNIPDCAARILRHCTNGRSLSRLATCLESWSLDIQALSVLLRPPDVVDIRRTDDVSALTRTPLLTLHTFALFRSLSASNMPLETLYLATTPANKRLILHGNLNPEILPPSMGSIGNVKALLMTRDRSHAIELGHLEGNPRHGHHGELVPALLCEYQLNTDGLEGYDISPIPADQLEKRELEEEHKEVRFSFHTRDHFRNCVSQNRLRVDDAGGYGRPCRWRIPARLYQTTQVYAAWR